MPDYQKGKIYAIWDDNYTECYIGSTTQELSMRMSGHRSDYRRHLQSKFKYYSLFGLFDKYDHKKCRIELIETYPCHNKSELQAREGFHQREHFCMNRRIEGRDRKQYYQDNKEYISQKNKEWKQQNTDRVKEMSKVNHKLYYQVNRDTILKKKKENRDIIKEYQENYRQQNKDLLQQKSREYYLNNKQEIMKVSYCECGGHFTKNARQRHLKTLKHQQYLNQTGNDEP